MSTTVITGLQNRVKNSFAVAEELGVVLVANGEELPYLLTPYGEQFAASIPAPTSSPVVATAGAGNITDTKWVVYAYCYAIDGTFPLISASIKGLPIIDAPFQVTGGDSELVATFVESDIEYVNAVYFYRTAVADTEEEAQLLADSGAMYLVAVTDNVTGVINDNQLAVEGNPPIDLTGFVVPQFRFCVFDGDFFWGFGNYPLTGNAVWNIDGSFIFTDATSSNKFYSGREGQYITFEGVSLNGIDGKGTFIFKFLTDTTGQVVDEDGNDAVIGADGEGTFVLQGESGTLYRSAYRNPFSWGYLTNIAGEYIPARWELVVGGGFGSAIAVVPNQNLLKLDLEFPTLCLTFNLQASDSDQFVFTKQVLSRVYSVTSHFSQFPAVSNNRSVLWGMDYKNFAILESDGLSQTPISGPISSLLRQLTKERYKHRLSHGIQDAAAEINAIWLTTGEEGSSFLLDYCVYYHWPTGFWGVIRDYGVLCSSSIESVVTGERQTFVGTQTGFVGRAFDPSAIGDWIPPEGLYSGTVLEATTTTLTRDPIDGDFSPSVDGVVGNYVVVTSSDGLRSEVRLITEATESMLTVDRAFDNPVAAGYKFFIGLIEVSMLKYFDNNAPAVDKTPLEFWATVENADTDNPPMLQFFPEHSDSPTLSIELKQDAETDAWFTKKGLPTKLGKSFGLALVDRSYNRIKYFNITLK